MENYREIIEDVLEVLRDMDQYDAIEIIRDLDADIIIERIQESWQVWGNNMKLTEFMDERYKNREDKDNIFGVGVSDAEFRTFIINYLLGEDWYVLDPLGQTQINEIALYEILEKYSRRYRKECKRWKERNKNE